MKNAQKQGRAFTVGSFEACFQNETNAEMFKQVSRLLFKMQEKRKLGAVYLVSAVFAEVFCNYSY